MIRQVLAILAIAATSAHADDAADEKRCILSAASRVPFIQGQQIIASRAKPLPAEFKPEPGVYRTIVELDAKAAGQDVTYHFVCLTSAGKPAFVEPFKAP